MCGEQVLDMMLARRMAGSPPRVRGTDHRSEPPPRLYRITPACAGNSRTGGMVEPGAGITPACAGNSAPAAAKTAGPRDHPRVCGEQAKAYCPGAKQKGSPPRVRGTVCTSSAPYTDVRIPPACAGNSLRRSWPGFGRRDHPRVCGEQSRFHFVFPHSRGSPPRVRGTVYS